METVLGVNISEKKRFHKVDLNLDAPDWTFVICKVEAKIPVSSVWGNSILHSEIA